jgi:hypothetical protein
MPETEREIEREIERDKVDMGELEVQETEGLEEEVVVMPNVLFVDK